MEGNKGLIIFEKAMNKRFMEMGNIHGLEVFTADLENNFHGNPVKNIFKRLLSKKSLLETTAEIEAFIIENKLETVYFSTSEGYVSHNIISHLKIKVPNIYFIALQHGVFPLKYSKSKELARRIVNNLSKTIFGVYAIGAGFGGIPLNSYYVYSLREKDFLINYKKWKDNQVYAKLDFIKADLLFHYNNSEVQQDSETAIFLMQCLHLAGLCSAEEEIKYTNVIIEYLSKKYQNVLIKLHPACINQLDSINLPKNVIVVKDMIDGFKKCKNAYSFFSTALIDAKIFNLKTIGIKIKGINIDDEIYKNFDLTLDFEDILVSQV
ncbi:polysialyltransferase family glycosyltransferase [Maribacter aquivivus]|uniref:polysialyltransferase family glycosyltransferase n=1 Tax=Maribacter aquivivus TaxID=228958 RepID=UPI002490FB42|nr:polysialyltransferase family glycosyltransferase [Maribacter aquivivus]